MNLLRWLTVCGLTLGLIYPLTAQQAVSTAPPDDRYKADILLVVAHPDDESVIAGYLARAIYDEHKRVAAVFCTRGNSGNNSIGSAQAGALGAEREIEARRALESFGVMNVWFLGGIDTYGQEPLRSLEVWNHGSHLWNIVRLVRLTRPEVIITWLPDCVVGENHGDHQASGVVATEAFDLAGDPTAFAEQVGAPRNDRGVINLVEGLQAWQPKKIYYFTDASHREFLDGQGPTYSVSEISPSRHVPYSELRSSERGFHLTQYAPRPANAGPLARAPRPAQFIFGKSLVDRNVTADIFAGVEPGAIPFTPPSGFHAEAKSGLWMEVGSSWAFYRAFWKAHDIAHLENLLPMPELGVSPGGVLYVPLLLHNNTGQTAEITVNVAAPPGWNIQAGAGQHSVPAGDAYPAEVAIAAPSSNDTDWHEIVFSAQSGGQTAGSVHVRVRFRGEGGVPGS